MEQYETESSEQRRSGISPVIRIGCEIYRWYYVSQSKNLQSDEEVAKLLLDCYFARELLGCDKCFTSTQSSRLNPHPCLNREDSPTSSPPEAGSKNGHSTEDVDVQVEVETDVDEHSETQPILSQDTDEYNEESSISSNHDTLTKTMLCDSELKSMLYNDGPLLSLFSNQSIPLESPEYNNQLCGRRSMPVSHDTCTEEIETSDQDTVENQVLETSRRKQKSMGCLSRIKYDTMVLKLKGKFSVPVCERSQEQKQAMTQIRKQRNEYALSDSGQLLYHGKIVIVADELTDFVKRMFIESNVACSRVLYNLMTKKYTGFTLRNVHEIISKCKNNHKSSS